MKGLSRRRRRGWPRCSRARGNGTGGQKNGHEDLQVPGDVFAARPLDQEEIVEPDAEGQKYGVFLRSQGQDRRNDAESPERPLPPGPVRRPSLEIQVQGRDVKEPGHAGHALDDVGDGGHLDGARGPEDGSQEGDAVGGRPVALPENGQVQGVADEEEQEDRRQVVDGEVDEVVAEDVEAPDIAVQGEAQVGEGPFYLFALNAVKGFFDLGPVQGLEGDVPVIADVGLVVEDPRPLEAVPVDDEEKDEEGGKGEGVLPSPGETPPDVKVKPVFPTDHGHLDRVEGKITETITIVKENTRRFS